MRPNPSSVRAAALALALGVRTLSAQSAPDLSNAGALFLLLPVGADAVGIGQAAATLAGRGDAIFWNPAGLATLPRAEFGVSTANFAAGPATAVTLFAPRHGIGVFGGGVYLLNYGDEDVVDSAGVATARISPRNVAYLVSFATELPGAVDLGVTYKLVQFRVDCSGDCSRLPNGSDALTHALDVGGQVPIGAGGALRLAAAVRNLGFRLQVNNRDQADALPTRLVVGARYRVGFAPGGGARPVSGAAALAPAAGVTDPDRLDLEVAADVDAPWDNSAPPEMRVGLDVGYGNLVRLRGGYAFVRQGLSGASVGLGVESGSVGVDLARTFLTGSDLAAQNPTFVSFRLSF